MKLKIFQLPEGYRNPVLNIYNTYGILIRQLNISEKNTLIWDVTDSYGNRIKDGMYLYNISFDNYSSQFNKLLFIN
jgi:flagellar hook assembly protein FlgD